MKNEVFLLNIVCNINVIIKIIYLLNFGVDYTNFMIKI